MLISGCEILAPKLLLHSQTSVRKHYWFSVRGFFSLFFLFFFWISAQIHTGVKMQGEGQKHYYVQNLLLQMQRRPVFVPPRFTLVAGWKKKKKNNICFTLKFTIKVSEQRLLTHTRRVQVVLFPSLMPFSHSHSPAVLFYMYISI